MVRRHTERGEGNDGQDMKAETRWGGVRGKVTYYNAQCINNIIISSSSISSNIINNSNIWNTSLYSPGKEKQVTA